VYSGGVDEKSLALLIGNRILLLITESFYKPHFLCSMFSVGRDVKKSPQFFDIKVLKKLAETRLRDVMDSTKYIFHYIYMLYSPSWGARSGIALKHRAYHSKRLKAGMRQRLCFQRAGQYLKCNAYRHRVRPSKRLKEKRTSKTMSLTGLTCA
jgi:hypothetical protein